MSEEKVCRFIFRHGFVTELMIVPADNIAAVLRQWRGIANRTFDGWAWRDTSHKIERQSLAYRTSESDVLSRIELILNDISAIQVYELEVLEKETNHEL